MTLVNVSAVLSLIAVITFPLSILGYIILFFVAGKYDQEKKKRTRIKGLFIFSIPVISFVTLLILIIVSAFSNKTPSQVSSSSVRPVEECLTLNTDKKKGMCLSILAVARKDVKICYLIEFSEPYWQDSCFATVAMETKNTSLCDESGSFKDQCYASINSKK